jgi:hypothetical protein
MRRRSAAGVLAVTLAAGAPAVIGQEPVTGSANGFPVTIDGPIREVFIDSSPRLS